MALRAGQRPPVPHAMAATSVNEQSVAVGGRPSQLDTYTHIAALDTPSVQRSAPHRQCSVHHSQPAGGQHTHFLSPLLSPRAAAQRVYDATGGRDRTHRLKRVCTELLHAWRQSLVGPTAWTSAGIRAPRPGLLAEVVLQLAEVVLQRYSTERVQIVGEVGCLGCHLPRLRACSGHDRTRAAQAASWVWCWVGAVQAGCGSCCCCLTFAACCLP